MTERTIILHPHEACAAADGRLALIVRPVKFNLAGRIERGSRQWHPYDSHAFRGCQYQPGTILACRETWRLFEDVFGRDFVAYKSGKPVPIPNNPSLVLAGHCFDRWHSSTTMPHWAVRSRLRVLSVEVKHLHEITDDEIIASGITGTEHGADQPLPGMCFEAVWNRHYAKRGLGWDVNPWAWFVRVEAA